MTTGPRFQFLSRSDKNDPGALSEPDAWYVLPYPGETYQTHGVSLDSPSDPYASIDQFFSQFDGGIIAGWLSYELSAWNHDLPRPDRTGDELPLIGLAHFSDPTDSLSPEESSTFHLGEFDPVTDRTRYEDGVEEIRRLIREGYVYQVNLSQRFEAPVTGRLDQLLSVLDDDLLPPHGVYGTWEDHEFLSLSPERFFRVEGNEIHTQPIKGTRPRGGDPHGDDRLREQLLRSEKDRAEHAMIVDLERNDLNRVCRPGTVTTTELSAHYTYPTVHHLVSTVKGKLRSDVTPGSLFRNVFPGGSITGAPKHTAVRVIDRLESRNRGLYTGTIGYWDLDQGVADWNIAIRTLVRRGERAWWDSGGGIVIDSDPAEEYRESLDKVTLIRRINQSTDQPPTEQLRAGEVSANDGPLV